MTLSITSELIRIVVLDVSGLYVQIYDQVLIPPACVDGFMRDYMGSKRFKCLCL